MYHLSQSFYLPPAGLDAPRFISICPTENCQIRTPAAKPVRAVPLALSHPHLTCKTPGRPERGFRRLQWDHPPATMGGIPGCITRAAGLPAAASARLAIRQPGVTTPIQEDQMPGSGEQHAFGPRLSSTRFITHGCAATDRRMERGLRENKIARGGISSVFNLQKPGLPARVLRGPQEFGTSPKAPPYLAALARTIHEEIKRGSMALKAVRSSFLCARASLR